MSDEAVKHEPKVIALDNLKEDISKPEPVNKAPRLKDVGVDELREQLKRRRVPRRPVHSPVGVLYKGEYQIATCFEIGEGGMLINSNVKIQQDDSVVVTLLIPGVMDGVMIGKVVYAMASEKQEHARYGIMFEIIDFEVKRRIRNYVASATNYVIGGSG